MKNNYLLLDQVTQDGEIITFVCIDTEAILMDTLKDTDELPVYKFQFDRSDDKQKSYLMKLTSKFVTSKTRSLKQVLNSMVGNYFFWNPAFLVQ